MNLGSADLTGCATTVAERCGTSLEGVNRSLVGELPLRRGRE